MVRIRLRRMGSKKQAQYRIVVTDREAPRDGAFIETIGLYNPRTEPSTITVQEDRALYWMNVGAQPSDSCAQLLKKLGTLDRFARLKKGEPPEVLLAEAAANLAPVPNPKTRIGRTAAPKAKKAEVVSVAE